MASVAFGMPRVLWRTDAVAMVYNTALAKRMSAAKPKGPPTVPLDPPSLRALDMQDVRQSPCLNNFVAAQQKMH
jgi:hypothetical protein